MSLDIITHKVISSPIPRNLSYFWNFGSLLGTTLVVQIITGFFLSMFYENRMSDRFDSIIHIIYDINMGWLLRSAHANGARVFFIIIYLHTGRNLYYKTYTSVWVWVTGVCILFILFIVRFLGYVLPWGQIRFWGATVITNLVSSIPYIGNIVTMWLWGNFSVRKSTLMRFFSLHFIIPLIMCIVVIAHIILLHKKGSNNPLGLDRNMDKIGFSPYYYRKDVLGVITTLTIFIVLISTKPGIFIDPDNYIPANPLVTPPHIQPEWYFLFAYAILRSIPNKLGGVIIIVLSIFILLTLIFNKKIKCNYYIVMCKRAWYFIWCANFFCLMVIGSIPIEYPFDSVAVFCSYMYFMFFIIELL